MASKTFAKRLQEMSAARGLSAAELARRVGVSSTAVGNWNAGSVPRRKTLERIAEVLDVTADYLLTGKSPPAAKGTSRSIDDVINQATAEIARLIGISPDRVKLTLLIAPPE